MRAVTLDTFRPLYSAQESQMSLSPTIFTLRDARISVSSPYSSDETSNIKALIDEVLGFCSTLSIPYVDPYDGHVRFGGYFDNSWLRCESDVVEYIVLLDDCFDIRGTETIL